MPPLVISKTFIYQGIRMSVTVQDGCIVDVSVGGAEIAYLLSEEACEDIYKKFVEQYGE
jgi:hypothetical protein